MRIVNFCTNMSGSTITLEPRLSGHQLMEQSIIRTRINGNR